MCFDIKNIQNRIDIQKSITINFYYEDDVNSIEFFENNVIVISILQISYKFDPELVTYVQSK